MTPADGLSPPLPLGQLEPVEVRTCHSTLLDEWAAAVEFVARTVREQMLGRITATIEWEPEVVYDTPDDDGVSRPVGQVSRYRATIEGSPLTPDTRGPR